MAPTTKSFTTGPAVLADVGVLSYNGCIFSPLFESNVSGECIQDEAQRTVKYMEYTITVDGYVTLPDGDVSTSPTMLRLRSLLTAQAGPLIYRGRGNDIVVNVPGGPNRDAKWGPIPKLLEFQPLGAGRSAKVKWTVKVQIVEPNPGSSTLGGPKPTVDFFKPAGGRVVPSGGAAFGGGKSASKTDAAKRVTDSLRMLQFNYESNISYNEDGFSTLSIRGILEIPLTRSPNQSTRTFSNTADDLRGEINTRIMSGIDLTRFRMVKRNFNLSRDKRTLTWDFSAEEKPYMDMPADCTVARGSYTVRPAKQGMGLSTWLCTLRCTYTIRAGFPRRLAWAAFLALLRRRMSQSNLGNVVDNPKAPQAPVRAPDLGNIVAPTSLAGVSDELFNLYQLYLLSQGKDPVGTKKKDDRKAFLIDFSIDEGIYLDSKTVSFSATWKLMTTFSHILLASGIWSRTDTNGRTQWAMSMKDIQGVESWLPNKARTGFQTDIIVDFGGGQ